jgi:NADH dehydrogenase/NADH:ubiquinone oxidoreductase subunit G
MSETAVEQGTNDQVSGSVEDTTAPEGGATPKTFDEDYVKSIRNEAAKYRTQARENAEKAKQYDEYLLSQKSEQEKMAEALDAASRERDELKSQMLRLKIARDKQLPDSLVDRLRGETEEDMAADADALLEGLKGLSVSKPKPSVDDTGAGVTGDASAPSDPATLAERLMAHR